MRRLCQEALDTASWARAGYADVRVVRSRWQTITWTVGQGPSVRQGETVGIGVRARLTDSWGFASVGELSLPAARQVTARAVSLSTASGLIFPLPRPMAPASPIEVEWSGPAAVDPFAVPLDEKVELLRATEHALRGSPVVRGMRGRIHMVHEEKAFASSEGSFIQQQRTQTGAGYEAIAISSRRTAIRSFPQVGGLNLATGGWEVVESLDLPGSAVRTRDEATQLLSASPPAEGRSDLILSSNTVAALLHETCGHPAELDRVLDLDGDTGNASFLGAADIEMLRFGSDIVTIEANATEAGAAGTYGYDDEGVPAPSVRLVERGVWKGFMGNRETASQPAFAPFAGFARASGFNRPPLIRMANVSCLPGSWRLDDLIGDTSRGLLLDTPVRIDVGSDGGVCRCECEMGWEIVGGRIEAAVERPAFAADTLSLWNSVDAIAGREHYALWSIGPCTKGTPRQPLDTGHGAAPARFRAMTVVPSDEG